MQRMPVGSITKFLAIYEEPFWRAEGLNGQSLGLNSPISLTLDACNTSGRPGIIMPFSAGPDALKLGRLREEQRRRRIVIETLTQRFGAKAGAPVAFYEHDWAAEEWTRGCYMAHYPPGVLTNFGPALRPPVGHIHWAGTETAEAYNGYIDGAIRSGERAAEEVLGSG
jgi:monoamine oxidase